MQITVDGKTVEARPLDFAIGREEWNEYKLLDGGAVRVKLVVTRIMQVL